MTAPSEVPPLELQVIGATIDDIREALGLEGEVGLGAELSFGHGATLTVEDLSKSSGFDATTVILTAMVSVGTTASREVLIEWLKSRLLHRNAKPSGGNVTNITNVTNVTVVIDGNELVAQTEP